MKKLAEKIMQVAFAKKAAVATVPVDHPNFWMYQ